MFSWNITEAINVSTMCYLQGTEAGLLYLSDVKIHLPLSSSCDVSSWYSKITAPLLSEQMCCWENVWLLFLPLQFYSTYDSDNKIRSFNFLQISL